MADQRWFDSFTFNRKAIDVASRREVVRAVATLFPGLSLGVTGASAGKKKGRNGLKC